MSTLKKSRVKATAPAVEGSSFAKLTFLAGKNGNFEQDINSLSGHLHDARLTPRDLTFHKRKVIVLLERDCWEIPYKKHEKSFELATARCQLEMSPVTDVIWHFSHDAFLRTEPIWLEQAYLGSTHFEKQLCSELILTAPHTGFRLTINFAEPPNFENHPKIELRDLATPAYWSDLHPNSK